VDAAPNKANPGRGGLGIDYGLGIIDDLGQGNHGRHSRTIQWDVAPNRPNFRRFWAKNEGGVQDKANRRRRDARRIDDGLGIIDDWGKAITDASGRRLRGAKLRPKTANESLTRRGTSAD
jgi:hypothetical protein